jgi:hypothetical protein
MNQTTRQPDSELFFVTNEKYVLGSPSAMSPSERTIDYTLEDLAKNYGGILGILKMPSNTTFRGGF